MRYLVVIEKGATSFGAYVPDLPGCVAAGETRDEALKLIREAIEFHIEGLKQEGQPVPPPSSTSEVVDIKLPNPAMEPAGSNLATYRGRRCAAAHRLVRPRRTLDANLQHPP
jgi:predicted RNase H-like HicB family nuclease